MFKKCVVILALSLLVFNLGISAGAEQSGIQVEANKTAALIDGIQLESDSVLYNGRLYVSLKEAGYYLNCSFKTDDKSKTINIVPAQGKIEKPKGLIRTLPDGKININAVLNGYDIKFNGIDMYMNSILYKDVIYVPFRYMAEIFNYRTEWNETDNTTAANSKSVYPVGDVNGESITNKDFYFMFNPQFEQLQRQGRGRDAAAVKSLKANIFDELESIKILNQKALQYKIGLDENDLYNINLSIKNTVIKYGGIENFRTLLSGYDTYFSQVAFYIRDNYIISKLQWTVTQDVTASDDKILDYYNAHKNEFIMPESVRAKHILILTMDEKGIPVDDNKKAEAKKKAQGILDRIKSGENFDKLMNAYSQDTGLKSSPNGYTFMRGQMVKEFEDSAFSLNVGEVSGLVETQYGYHIIRLEEKIPQKQLTVEDVKDQIKQILDPAEKQTYFENLLKQWKAASTVVNNL